MNTNTNIPEGVQPDNRILETETAVSEDTEVMETPVAAGEQPEQPEFGVNVMGIIFAVILGVLGVLTLLLSLNVHLNWVYVGIGVPTGLAILLILAALVPSRNR